jgi:hypothetical protein
MGLGPMILGLSSLGFPLCVLCFQVFVFCLDFDPFFLLPCSLVQFYLYIYFIKCYIFHDVFECGLLELLEVLCRRLK